MLSLQAEKEALERKINETSQSFRSITSLSRDYSKSESYYLRNILKKHPKLNFHVIGVATGAWKNLCLSLRSAIVNGIRPTILSWGIEYRSHKEYRHQTKVLEFISYLKNLPSDDIVLFSDTYDSLYLRGPDEILERFMIRCPVNSSGEPACSFLVSAERVCWPLKLHVCKGHFKDPGPYNFINTGSWIAYAGAALAIFSDIEYELRSRPEREHFEDDQSGVQLLYIHNKEKFKIEIDYEFFIFSTVYLSTQDFSISNGSAIVLNSVSKTSPAILHFNSDAKPEFLHYERNLFFNKLYRHPEIRKEIEETMLNFIIQGNVQQQSFKEICDEKLRKDWYN